MINLLPPEIKEDIRYGKLNVQIRWYVGLTAIVVAGVAMCLLGADLYGQREVKHLEREHSSLIEKLGPTKSLGEEAKVLEAKLLILKALYASETNYVALLEDIEKTIVPGARLQQLELNGDESKALELKFTISEEIIAATLRNSLEASPRFKFVDVQDITTSSDEAGQQITVTYKLSYEPGQAR